MRGEFAGYDLRVGSGISEGMPLLRSLIVREAGTVYFVVNCIPFQFLCVDHIL